MPTVGRTELCPKCGKDVFEIEWRYGDERGECLTCGYFYEHGPIRREGVIHKTPEEQDQYMMIDTWFMLPSCFAGGHIEYTVNSEMRNPAKLNPTGLFLTAKRGECDVVRAALAADSALVHTVDPKFGLTLLHAAALGGWPEMIRLLLEAGADFDRRDGDGQTPLDLAVELGYEEAATILMQAGACLSGQNEDV